MDMTPEQRSRAIAMWGLALCLTAAAAGWMFLRFGQAWSVADLPESDNVSRIVPMYIVAEIAMIPIGSKLVDLWGCRRMLLIGPMIFIMSSMLCILSPTVEVLIAFRFVQGIGAGLILGLAYASVGKFYEPLKRGKVIELMTGAFAVGSLFGSAVGYFLTETFNWRCGFIAFGAMAAVGFVLALKYLPKEEVEDRKPDVAGMAICTIVFGAAALYTQMVNLDFKLLSVPSIAMALIIIIGVVILLHHSSYSDSPVIPVRISGFEKKIIVLMFVFSLCGLGLIQYFYKLYLTYYEFDIYKASFMFLLLIAGAAGPSMLGSRKVFTTGVRPWLIVGSIAVTIALIIAHFIADQGVTQFGITMVLLGFGLGCIVNQLICALQSVSEQKDMGQHTGNLMAVRMIGILVGNAIVGSYISEVIHSGYVPKIIDISTSENIIKDFGSNLVSDIQYAGQALDDGLMVTLLIMSVITAILAILSYTLGRDDVQTDATSEE